MRPLLKIILLMLLVFGVIFLGMQASGVLTLTAIEGWLRAAHAIDPIILGAGVVGLLVLDLFITVPTLSVALLAGYFLGFGGGGIAVALGIAGAGMTAYGIGHRWGPSVIARFIRNPDEQQSLQADFHRFGPIMIMLARAAPMMPEITACLAGATHMKLARFVSYFAVGNLPYILVTVGAGSLSDIDNPMPALYAVLAVYAVTWSGLVVARRRRKPANR